MKIQKLLVVLAAWLFIGGTIYYRVSNIDNERANYEATLVRARDFVTEDLIARAEDEYNKALGMKDSLDLRLEIGQMYLDKDMDNKVVDWAEGIKNKYLTEPRAFSFLLNTYIENGLTEKAFQLYDEILGRKVNSPEAEALYKKIEYSYDKGTSVGDDVKIFRNGYWLVLDDKDGEGLRWGLMDVKATVRIGSYLYAGTVNKDGIVAARESLDHDWGYYNSTGDKLETIKDIEDITYLGEKGNELTLVIADGVATFYDENWELKLGPYLDATEFSNGFAFVQAEDELWYAVNAEGKFLNETGYDEVVMNNARIASVNGSSFVKKDDRVIMLNHKCQEIDLEFKLDNAKLFHEFDGLAAVQIDGYWGLMDKTGKIVIEPTYVDADSSSHGMAAVKNETGNWGLINMENYICLPFDFTGIMPVNNKGVTLVSKAENTDNWFSIYFYKDNH